MLHSAKRAWAVATTLICGLPVSYQYREVSPPSITAGPSPHKHTHLHNRLKSSMTPSKHVPFWATEGGWAPSCGYCLWVEGPLQACLFHRCLDDSREAAGGGGGHHLSTAQALPNSKGSHSHTQHGSPSSRPPPSLRRPVFPSTSLPT